MNDVIGFDDYEDDFCSVALPEYKWMAEQCLLEAIESCEPEEHLEVHMPDELSKDENSYTFRFDVQLGGNEESGGILIIYTGFY